MNFDVLLSMKEMFYSYNHSIMGVYFTICMIFVWSMPRRSFFIYRILASIVICYFAIIPVNMISISVPLLSLTLKYLIITFLGIFAVYACFKVQFSFALIIGLVSYTYRHMIYLVVEIFKMVLFDNIPGFNLDFNVSRYLLEFCTFLFFVPFMIYIHERFRKYHNVNISIYKTFIIVVTGLFSTIIFNYFNLRYFHFMAAEVKYSMYFFSLLVCWFSLVLSFLLVRQEKVEAELAVMKQMEYERSKQYEQSKENIDLINIKCHDLRHQIRQLKKDISNVNEKELESIEHQIRIYDTKVKTGNIALDTILTEKSLICQKNSILFDCIIDGQLLHFIPEEEIYSLFGNIIDNAIESTMKVEEKDFRIITLKISSAVGGVYIMQENPYAGELEIKNGLPVTKKNADYHGFGMKSIRNIVDRHNGILKIDADKNSFRLQIFFSELS